jgi:hypothetical protein
MRSTILLLLALALVAGCVRSQTVESDLAKTNLTGGRAPGTNTATAPSSQSLTSRQGTTAQDLVDALNPKGVDVDLRPVPALDRHGALASVLTLRPPGAGEPPQVLVYLCENEDLAGEQVRLLGGSAFASGRFAIAPYQRTPGDLALAQKIRKALE